VQVLGFGNTIVGYASDLAYYKKCLVVGENERLEY
jgi:hypothetical protein